jgi:hypothetical protein
VKALRLAPVVVIAACAPTAPRAIEPHAHPAPAIADAGTDGGHASTAAARDAAPGPEPEKLEFVEGCREADVAAMRVEIEAIAERVREPAATAPAILAQLRALWEKPCLAHVARFIPPPAPTTLKSLQEAFDRGFESSLELAAGGLHVDKGVRYLALPQEIVPELAENRRNELGALLCKTKDDATCAAAASFTMRAEQAFDARREIQFRSQSRMMEAGRRVVDTGLCSSDGYAGTLITDQTNDTEQTKFEAWARCAYAQGGRVLRYADTPLRAPDHGGLVLRGRRGHYQFADEIRAYDLASGAAYVARRESGLVLGDADFAPSAKRTNDGVTGSVIAAQVRELAFVLMSRKALVEVRSFPAWVVVPAGMPFTLTKSRRFLTPTGLFSWSSSAQTDIDFAYVVDNVVRQTGRFTWPDSSEWPDDYADDLIRAMEAGFAAGCAPARLPAQFGTRVGAVSPIDASAKQVDTLQAALERTLNGLRSKACASAR